jgi:hypothetical protein
MLKRAKPILLFTLMFAAFALLGSAPAWAVQPACQEVQIFQNQTMIVWNPGCTVLQGVYYWKGISGDIEYDEDCDTSVTDCSPTNCSACPGRNCDTCWRKGQEIRMVMCTCEGSQCLPDDPVAGIDIYTNIERERAVDDDGARLYPYVKVECSAITDSGPELGCPLYLNPPRTTIGARAFR